MEIADKITMSNLHFNFNVFSPLGHLRRYVLAVSIALIVSVGCGHKQNDWHKLPKAESGIPPYARYLQGIKICLDPGHGGQGHLPEYKRGPTGLREAEVNLRVALYLRDFLSQAGAIVVMTRTDDSFVSIPDRADIANRNEVDFFISIHHNSIDVPRTNYTSTWYHRDADDSPADLDLARYIQQSVSEALRLPQLAATGLYSDQLMVPSGFGVLRLTKAPAVVCEASFYSNPKEEKRLRKKSYNRREAYGYFLGIARYVAAGFPQGVLQTPAPESTTEHKTPRIEISISDGIHTRGAWILKRQQVFSDSIRVKLDGVIVQHQYIRDSDLIVVTPTEPLSNGVHWIETSIVNYYGNHNLPTVQWFKVAPPAAELELTTWAKVIPPDGESYVGIAVAAYDSDGQPIADDEPIHAQTTVGRLTETVQLSKNGTARFYLRGDPAIQQSSTAHVKVVYKDKQETISVGFGEIQGGIVQGRVKNATGNTLGDATIRLVKGEERITSTDSNGHFFYNHVSPGEAVLLVSKAGYYSLQLREHVVSNRARIIHPKLQPICEGALIGQTFVLDARYGGAERGTPPGAADINLAVVNALGEMLRTAGAKVYLIRKTDREIAVPARVAAVNAIQENGYYLRIDHGNWTDHGPSIVAAHYPGNQVAERYVQSVLEYLLFGNSKTSNQTLQDPVSPEIRSTNKIALTLEIRSINHPTLGITGSRARIMEEAYYIFLGTCNFIREGNLPKTQLDVNVIDQASGKPLTNADIALDGTLRLLTDSSGKVIFKGFSPRIYRLVVRLEGYAEQEITVDTTHHKRVVVELKPTLARVPENTCEDKEILASG